MNFSEFTDEIYKALKNSDSEEIHIPVNMHFWCWDGSIQMDVKEIKYDSKTNTIDIAFVNNGT